MTPPIAILTDFGLQDPYVGIVKGVILQRVQTALIDLTHDIPHGDIRRTSFVLWQSLPAFPEGTVFLVVVDPGVGSARLPVIVESRGYRFVAPDNGVLTYALEGDPNARAWALANPAFHLPLPSKTFHGRDIFAPAAAYAALGVPGRAFGPMVPSLQRLPLPECKPEGNDYLHGEMLHADRFGNILTSLGVFRPDGDEWLLMPWLRSLEPRYFTPAAVRLPNGTLVPMVSTFAEIPAGEIGALIGSTGLIEIAANGQSAAAMLKWQPGDKVTLFSKKAYRRYQNRKKRGAHA